MRNGLVGVGNGKYRAPAPFFIGPCILPSQVDPTAKLPVLVFVHGGSFHTGYAGQKPPTALLDEEDIVLVSPQYRLGPLGECGPGPAWAAAASRSAKPLKSPGGRIRGSASARCVPRGV